jgi:two-component system, OmpR family, sensor histidine kinase KdpD
MAATETGRRWGSLSATFLRVGCAVAAVAASTAVLTWLDADLAVTVSVLLLVTFATAVFGYAPGLVAAATSFGALVYYFTPPIHSFAVNRTDDLVALLVFVAIATAVATTVARLNELRNRSEVGEQEAQLRLRFTNRLATGADPGPVLEAAVRELVELFQLSSCSVESVYGHIQVGSKVTGTTTLTLSPPGLSLGLERARRFSSVESSTIEALVSSLASVLERVRLDAESRELRVRGEVTRSRTGFLTAMTHDLRTPLATIKASTGALLVPGSQLDAAGRREMLELAYAESARLERLVRNVLEMSRIRADGLAPQRVAISAADFVQTAVDRLGALGSTHDIDLDVDVRTPPLWVDPGMLERVMSNLLENAVVHGGADSPIEIRARRVDATVQLRVVDHGKGVTEEERDRIFEEFVRSAGAQSGRGTGLGLAIVRALVESNGGRVWYEETSGGGATFVLALPAAGGGER